MSQVMFKLSRRNNSIFVLKYFVRSMSEACRIVAVRKVVDDEYMDLSFKYENPSLGLPERQFNFRRKKEEPLIYAFNRMSSNITTIVEKKLRAKKKKAKTDPPQLEIPTINISLQYNGNHVDSEAKNDDAWQEGAVFKIDETEYTVCINAPKVISITLPTTIMIGFPVNPKVELEFAALEESTFVWYSFLPHAPYISQIANAEPVGIDLTYIPKTEDLGKRLVVVCTPKMGNRIGLEVLNAAAKVVEAGPGPCPFEERHAFTAQLTGDQSIRCVSYNILADLYADSDTARTQLFPYCPPYALEGDYRKQLCLKEISGYNADIMCLQEVDSKLYRKDIFPYLKSQGLDGAFMEKGGQVVEGLACFVRSAKFRIIACSNVVFGETLESEPIFADIYDVIKKNEQLLQRVLKRTTAIQTVLLESVQNSGELILVGNTHLYFHPDADHIRLLQAAMCLRFLQKQIEIHREQHPNKNISLILCGDFNSCPEFGVYRLVTEGFVPEDLADWASNKDQEVKGLSVSHQFQLRSACGCPPYTNYTTGFSGCLDYIFYDCSNLEVEEVIPLPSHEQVVQYTALPNIVFPSDHLALVCVLRWKEAKSAS